MKNAVIPAVSLLFFCGGLFCIHLAAQPERAGNAPASGEKISLLDPKVVELSERELLERKVDVHRNLVAIVNVHAQAGSPRGRLLEMMEAHVRLASAEIELYRYTGEREKLLAAHKARVEALTHKLQGAAAAVEAAAYPEAADILHETEIQLLDALLEQKRVQTR